MFNGYNETPLISYEFNQERVEKKHENVQKWSYGHETGVQPAQNQLNNRHGEFWCGKSNLLGIPNVVKCNCTGCYPSPEKQSYQGDTTRHRPWLPRTFPVPVNGSNEPCKLPGYQWDNGLSNQNPCYPENGLSYVQENGGKYPYYKHYQNSNQPGVITSVKNAEFRKKSKSEIPLGGQESPVQNGVRQPVFCNPGYGLSKRPEGRHYCDPNEKYSNVASYSVDQHVSRLPVVEPFIKAVPSNLSQSRVPSTGYGSVKENATQSYVVDPGFMDPRKLCTESAINGDKRTETFSAGQLQTGVHADYSHFNRDVPEMEPQKFFDNTRHPDYYPRNNFQDVLKRNTQSLDNRRDCAMNQMSMSEQHFNISRTENGGKSSCDMFYPKDFEKPRPENHLTESSACLQRNDDPKNENMNVHARLPPSSLLFNDPRFADRSQNSFPYQNNPVACRNYLRPEYPYQGYNTQARYDYSAGFQRNDLNQFRTTSGQQMQSCEQFASQQGNGFVYDCQSSLEKMQQFCGGKNQSPVQTISPQLTENRKPAYLEAIRSEEVNKNGANKISPLRLLRKKKFVNVPQEPTPVSTLDAVSGLDVRKFWSTWADEDEENVAPTQVVVLDCQNIDAEQAKLLHLYETDPGRAIHLESSNLIIKNTGNKEPSNETCEETKTWERPMESEVEQTNATSETEVVLQNEAEKSEVCDSTPTLEPENKVIELNSPKTSPKSFKKGTHKEKKKAEIMDKWTEKKFDFLKRAEESKAAEVLRHEEEKKKIFETRLSLQQSLKTNEKQQEKYAKEVLSPFDENSQCESPDDGKNASDLPTCEYRRNKFLDYSEKKEIETGKSKTKEGEEEAIEDNIKVEHSEESAKFKDENGFEMDDILKKMSDITFQCAEMRFENGLADASGKKSKPFGKKIKKKKGRSDPPENDDRTDKLTLETVTKPTIKFSIQKSHDLKISFKVLNSSKEYSDEEAGGEDEETKPGEDSKNSTELITLKYKSMSDSKKNRQRKKRNPKVKTLKIKKSRYMPEEERDPLADDEEVLKESKKPFPDECLTSDDFQVQETMDSAKIKLTFKRHKGNFETEYKINSNNAEVDPTREESPNRSRKKSKKAKKHEIFAEAGVKTFENPLEPTSDIDRGSETKKPRLESMLEEDSRNSSFSQNSCNDEENYEPLTFSEFPSDPELVLPIPCDDFKSNFEEEMGKHDGVEDLKWNSENDKPGPEPMGFAVTDDNEVNESVEEKCEFPLSSPESEEKTASFEQEIQKISLDFIRNETTREIGLNCDSESTEETKNRGETVKERVCGLGNFEEEISHFETQEESSYESKSEKGDDDDALKESKTNENWKNYSDVSSPLPSLDFDNENYIKNAVTCEGINKVKRNEGALTSEEIPEEEENHDNAASHPNDKSVNSNCGFSPSEESFLTSEPSEKVHGESGGEKSNENVSCQSPPEKGRSNIDPTQGKETTEEVLRNGDVKICCRFESSVSLLPFGNEKLPENDYSPVEDKVQFSPENKERERSTSPSDKNINSNNLSVDIKEKLDTDEKEEEHLTVPSPRNDDSGCAECSFSSGEGDEINEIVVRNLPSVSDIELEDGEIMDSCEEIEESSPEKEKNWDETRAFEKVENLNKFITKKIERRHSIEKLDSQTWYKKKFTKAKSCPPEINLLRLLPETPICIPLEDIPLPLGPPPHESCFDFTNKVIQETEEKPEERSVEEPQLPKKKTPADASHRQLLELTKLQDLPPAVAEPPPGIFQRSTKIKFSFLKRSKFSKFISKDLNFGIDDKPKVEENFEKGKPEENSEEVKIRRPDSEENPEQDEIRTPHSGENPEQDEIRTPHSGENPEKDEIRTPLPGENLEKDEIRTPHPGENPEKDGIQMPHTEENPEKDGIRTPDPEESPKECQIEEVPNENEANRMEEEKIYEPENKFGVDREPFGVKDLVESVEVIDAMTDFMRDEFYECEDIPTSEDLTNGEDLEIEKVNDDKFRNIMQNCLDNAKKFLNVGNLKLFSCSVDDLLGLDYQSSGLEESEPEKPTNHVSRDVLLTSCEDINDDLGLSENMQPVDISMDFVTSFCSDVCPEILPVDNWPYLEEEVPSSPSKTNETDFIQPLEHDPFDFEVETPRRKRINSETGLRRRSLAPENDAPCSKIGVQRRNTIETFNGESYGKDISGLRNDIIRLKSETDTENSLKCRLNLDKINENGINFGQKSNNPVVNAKGLDYKSPLWQPKVMLFRISKNELRKVLKSSKNHSLFKTSGDSSKRKNSEKSESVIKKHKSDTDLDKFYVKSVQEIREEVNLREEKSVELPKLDSIKGSLTSADVKKSRKSRFRNLHTRRKPGPESTKEIKDVRSSGQSTPTTEKASVDAEADLAEILPEGDRVKAKNEKVNNLRDNDETIKKKSKSEKIRDGCKEESKQDKHREKKHDHQDRRREKSEGREQHKHKDRRRESDGRRHERHKSSSSSSHERSKHHRGEHERKHSEKSRSTTSGGRDKKSKPQPDVWKCEVCGFDDASERVSHIKNHPFHCQSCHLAFKTEAHFIAHLTKKHKDIRNQHHCLLCELSFDTEDEYQKHLETREHTHLESVEKNTINTLFTLLTGAPCPVFELFEMKPEWLPNQAGTVHFYHQATPLSLALQYLKVHHGLSSFSGPPPARSG